ncbi:uncharacterized protein M6B38_379860 [Iris pallida]|uniref:Uncharacterized protein n=1 Tax=Iris pallida TaxID=29817 RepID=A0AAX6G997_IRIPA|nr:uncharacterized protein M6B38_379860 [Iris pallida]
MTSWQGICTSTLSNHNISGCLLGHGICSICNGW